MASASLTKNACSQSSYDVFTSDATLHSTIQGYVDEGDLARNGKFLARINQYLKDHPEALEWIKGGFDLHDVIEGTKKGFVAARYVGRMNVRVQDWGASGGASVLGVFVDYFGSMAEKEGIELNKLALDLTSVILDIAGAGTAAVSTAFTGPVGVLLLSVAVVKTFKDSYTLGKELMATVGTKD